MKKIYKRFEIKAWENPCFDCCMCCDYVDNCEDSCVNNDITCNQCLYNRED